MANREHRAMASWRGDLKGGVGTMSAPSGAFRDIEFTFATRFGDKTGTNPEELIGAAHAGCFSMQLSALLAKGGTPPNHIQTEATVKLKEVEGGFKISTVHLETNAEVPGVDNETFQRAVGEAKRLCPVSVLLSPGLDELTVAARLS